MPPNYDFNRLLQPEEFQDFARDILQVREKNIMESFRTTKDGGIDMKTVQDGKLVIGQAKRYRTYKELKSILENELKKVQRINPNRYILITSIEDFNNENKQKILEKFKGYIKDTNDILGNQDLNNLLGNEEYKQIEIKYTQLYIKSANLLNSLIDGNVNNKIYTMSRNKLKEVLENEKTYVEGEVFKEARNIIRDKHCLLITGEAGIGKTALAEHICYCEMMENEDMKFSYVYSFDEILSIYKENQNQIFLFDDFWGSVFKERYDKIEEKKMIDVIEMFSNDTTKRLVITSRNYIVQKAFKEHEQSRQSLEENRIIIELESFSEIYKTKILFNHLKESKLEWRIVNEIVKEYKRIIYHNMYNPRTIVRYLRRLEKEKSNDYPYVYILKLLQFLDNPEDLIEEVFQEQTEASKIILMILMLIGVKAEVKKLRDIYNDYIDINSTYARKNEFDISMKQLEKELIKVYEDEDFKYNTPIFVEFKDPSIEEFMYHFLEENKYEYLKDIIKSTCVLNIFMRISGAILLSINFNISKSEKNKGHKLYIEEDLKKELINNIIEKYNDLEYIYERDLEDNIFENRFSDFDKLKKIIQIYKEIDSEELKFFIEKKLNEIFILLEKEDEYFYVEDMYNVIPLIKEIKNTYMLNIKMNPVSIIQGFFCKIKFAEELLIMEKFDEVFPIEYSEFKKKNKDEIISKALSLILDDIDYFMSDGLYDKIDELMDFIYPEILESFNIPFDKKFDRTVYKLAERNKHNISKKEKEEWQRLCKQIAEERKRKEEEKNRIINKEKRLVLGKETEELDIKDVKKLLDEKVINPKHRKELKSIFNKRYYSQNFYIRSLFDTKESLIILINAINSKDVSLKYTRFLSDFTNFLLKDSKLGVKESINILSKFASEQMEKGLSIFSWENVIEDKNFKDKQDILEEFINIGILRKDEKWVEFITKELQIYLAVKQAVIRQIGCYDMLERYIKDNVEFEEDEVTIIKMYEIESKEMFKETFEKKVIDEFLQSINNTTERTICISIMKIFELELEMTKELQVGGSCENCSYIGDLLQSKDIYINDCNIIIEENNENNRIREEFKVKYYDNKTEKYKINMLSAFQDDDIYPILEEIGICEYFVNIYNEVLHMKNKLDKISTN